MKPFTLEIRQEELDDLKDRLKLTRWTEKETVNDWSQGIPLSYMREISEYWLNQYDWRRCENQLNQYPQFIMDIDGLDIHFLHIRSRHENAMPIVMTHGWPGSIIEFLKVIEPLVDPTKHGSREEDAFHLVLPSLPGFGFSAKPNHPGWGVDNTARAWEKLMARLGYDQYVAQGGDWGAGVALSIAKNSTNQCLAIHLNSVVVPPDPDTMNNLTEFEQHALDDAAKYQERESGYAIQQSSRPQTLGYGLVDSPIAQAAWIIEKFYAWTDCGEGSDRHPENIFSKDELLDNVMLYWLNATGASSGRIYWESFNDMMAPKQLIHTPIGCSNYPKEIFRSSRRWVEKYYTNIIYWNELDEGGHFAAFEQPRTFVNELRNCFSSLR